MTRDKRPRDPHRSGRTLHFAVLDHDGLDLFPKRILISGRAGSLHERDEGQIQPDQNGLSERAQTIVAGLGGPKGKRKTMVVNKITWAQVGRVTDPGRYMFKFGWLTIMADDLAIWQAYPNAAFTLLQTWKPTSETEAETIDEYRLGTFELWEHVSLSEK